MARRVNAEGGLIPQSRRAELLDLRQQQKATHHDLEQAKQEVKRLKAELEKLDRKLGWSIDHLDQADLPFPEDDSGNGNGNGNGEYTP